MMASRVPEALEPLVAAMGRDVQRLVVRAGWVMADRESGSQPLELCWTAEQHYAALEAVGVGLDLGDDAGVRVIDGSLVIVRAPPPDRTVEALIQDGRISPLAGRTLSCALGVGRNILLVSTSYASRLWIAALAAEGKRPAILGHSGDVSSGRWPLVSSVEESLTYGADRLGVWGLAPRRVGGGYGQPNGRDRLDGCSQVG